MRRGIKQLEYRKGYIVIIWIDVNFNLHIIHNKSSSRPKLPKISLKKCISNRHFSWLSKMIVSGVAGIRQLLKSHNCQMLPLTFFLVSTTFDSQSSRTPPSRRRHPRISWCWAKEDSPWWPCTPETDSPYWLGWLPRFCPQIASHQLQKAGHWGRV